MGMELDRSTYAALYGPTTGDRVRLGDTCLLALVDRDDNHYGSEPLVGQGKTIRDGMMASSRVPRETAVDLIISNVLVMDPVLGLFKSNIGIKDGRIVGIGRAGNPDIQDNVNLILDTTTGVVPGEGLIATPGGIDTHVHLITPRLIDEALSSGITSLIAAGSGGIWDVGTNPAYYLQRMFEAVDAIPINIGFLARGSSSHHGPIQAMVENGAVALKIHEDTGAYPRVLDCCLSVAEEMDVAVCLHTDGLNESGSLEDTLAAIAGRTVHAFHVEGAGGGHVPNILEIVGRDRIISSSTSPTIPYGIHAEAEHHEMITVVHRLSPLLPEDWETARSRVRGSTMAAESLLHDLGAIQITSSDSQGMGRIGETIRRTWQMADWMKRVSGEVADSDNDRILRYLAKYTINPAITHGISDYVGSLEPGKVADIVLWQPVFFGVRPEMVFKSGFAVWGTRGDGNGSTRICQPITYGPLFGSMGGACASLSLSFVSQTALDQGLPRRVATRRHMVPVRGTRGIGVEQMCRNSHRPHIRVDKKTVQVQIDGKPVHVPPAENVALNRLYLLG